MNWLAGILYTTNNKPLGCSSVILREEFNSAIAQPTELNATPGGRTGYASESETIRRRKCAISTFWSQMEPTKTKGILWRWKAAEIPQLWPFFYDYQNVHLGKGQEMCWKYCTNKRPTPIAEQIDISESQQNPLEVGRLKIEPKRPPNFVCQSVWNENIHFMFYGWNSIGHQIIHSWSGSVSRLLRLEALLKLLWRSTMDVPLEITIVFRTQQTSVEQKNPKKTMRNMKRPRK